MTLANKITLGRFFLSFVFFADVLLIGRVKGWETACYWAGIVLFLVTAVTDAVDGYYARKYKEVTSVGRIADPLVDKVVICGAFILFLAIPAIASILPAWMVAVVVIREFTVSGVRSAVEGKGIAFGANVWGKIKMSVQCGAVVTAMVYGAHFTGFGWAWWSAHGAMWIMLAATVASGAAYLLEARRLLRGA